MEVLGWLQAAVAAQLRQPHGLPGRLVGRMLNHGNKRAIGAAVDALTIRQGDVLADLGFGGGVGLALLRRRLGQTGQVHGIDLSETMIRAASRRFRREIEAGRLALHLAPIERLPLATASVDGAITVNTVYFVSDLSGALRECARVLKPGGRLIIGLSDPAGMAGQPLTSHGFRVRSVAEVTDALHDAGLEVEEHRRVGGREAAFHVLVSRVGSPTTSGA